MLEPNYQSPHCTCNSNKINGIMGLLQKNIYINTAPVIDLRRKIYRNKDAIH